MFNKDFDVDDVFNDYARRMEESGALTKKAVLAMPNFIAGNHTYSEIDITEELRAIATQGAGEGRELYNVFGKDSIDSFLNDAHPEGSVKIVDAKDGLGVVETLADGHKKVVDVATKKAALITKVIMLAGELDTAGLTALAVSLDEAIAKFADATPAEHDETASDTVAPMNFEAGDADEPARVNDLTGAPVSVDLSNKNTKDSKDIDVAQIKQKNIAAQKMLNKYLASAGEKTIPMTGVLDDAFKAALSRVGIEQGSYNSWGQLAHAISNKGQQYAMLKAKQNRDIPAGSGTQVARRGLDKTPEFVAVNPSVNGDQFAKAEK